MGWSGIQNLPPGFDVFGGKQPPPNIVDEAIRGKVPGLSPGREQLFADLKRNLLHQDYLRYFDSALVCSSVLAEVEDGKYLPAILKDIIEPALATAVQQLESIKADLERSQAAHRKLQYDPVPSMVELHRRSSLIARAYPQAASSREFEARCLALTSDVQRLQGNSPA
jgi:hypothetical protein